MGFIPEHLLMMMMMGIRIYHVVVGSDPDPSLFWCNNETAVSGQSLESCKNNMVNNDHNDSVVVY